MEKSNFWKMSHKPKYCLILFALLLCSFMAKPVTLAAAKWNWKFKWHAQCFHNRKEMSAAAAACCLLLNQIISVGNEFTSWLPNQLYATALPIKFICSLLVLLLSILLPSNVNCCLAFHFGLAVLSIYFPSSSIHASCQTSWTLVLRGSGINDVNKD